MTKQLRRHGWVYVLHDDGNLRLATGIKLGLNRLGYPIWVRERDAPDQTDLDAYHIGVQRAAIVVVLETALLRRSAFACELVEWAQKVPMLPPRFITVKVESGDSISWKGAEVPMQQSLRRLVHRIELWSKVVYEVRKGGVS